MRQALKDPLDRWRQKHDAILLSSGHATEKGRVEKRQFIEVTTSVQKNHHRLQEVLKKQGWSGSVKGISVDRKKGVETHPYVYSGREGQDDLAKQILERIKAKDALDYPNGTVLVVQCVLDRLTLRDEWEGAIQQVRDCALQHRFSEVFVFDSGDYYASSI